ncbi:MAG: hypothetical protein U0641_04660 [Anaerolineae bacterium]
MAGSPRHARHRPDRAVERVLAHPQHEYTQRLLADVPRLLGWGPAPDTEALSA